MTYESATQQLNEAEQLLIKNNFDEVERLARGVLDFLDSTDQESRRFQDPQQHHSTPVNKETEDQLRAHALRVLGLRAWHQGEYASALEHLSASLTLAESLNDTEAIAKALGGTGAVYRDLTNYELSLEYFKKALALNEVLGRKQGIAFCLSSIGLIYQRLSDGPTALEYLKRALAMEEQIGDMSGVAGNLCNIGLIYCDLSDYATALEYFTKALPRAIEAGNKRFEAVIMQNIGNVYEGLGDFDSAFEYFEQALKAFQELGLKSQIALVTGNMGWSYFLRSDNLKALEYSQRALALHLELGQEADVARITSNIGSMYAKAGEYSKAMDHYKRALAKHQELGVKVEIAYVNGFIGQLYANKDYEGYDLSLATEYLRLSVDQFEEIGNRHQLFEFQKRLAEVYKKQEQWKEFGYYFEKYHDLEKEVLSDEAIDRARLVEQQRQAERHENQLAIERSRSQERESILNNVLPQEITARLINGEKPIADHFDCVSVLFMDIVDFTPLASIISAQQVVHLLNAIFTAADNVIRDCGLEKIKTIGDCYMAVAGAPSAQEDHAQRAARAALKLVELMQNLEVELPENLGDTSWTNSLPEIQVRIGLHCGPAVAGVVGETKFLYDLWGDAVNTASRMESYGEPGRIHVSKDFKESVENSHATTSQFKFIERGDVEIKGKGSMRTFFLDRG